MPFEPSTSIFIGTVPFDSSYTHVRYFSNRSEQETYFKGLCPLGLRRDDYTYQRMNNSVIVEFKADELYGYNYCMFNNANYKNRWFYSFIKHIEYINESSSRLYLDLDIMQTWFLDTSVPACLVEREHVNDDRIGVNIKNEGIGAGSLKAVDSKIDQELNWCTVVSSVVEPTSQGYVNVRGDVYGHIYSGASRTVFIDSGGHNALTDFQSFMLALSNNGQQDAVSDAWMVPTWLASWGGESRIYDKEDGFGFWLKNGIDSLSGVKDIDYNFNFNSCDGYVPKNNKLFCYPFSKLVMSTSTGQQELVCEYFESVKGKVLGQSASIKFSKRLSWEPSTTPMIYPYNYNGIIGDAFEYAVEMPTYPMVSWVYQTFANMYSGGYSDKLKASISATQENFSTQTTNNQIGTAMSVLTGAATGAAAGAAAGSFVPGVGTAVGAIIGAGASAAGALASGMTTQNSITQNKENSLRTAKADLTAAGLSPNTVKGSISSSAQSVNSSLYGVWIRLYRPRYEMAKIIDDFFTMYGYNVSEIKQPNITGRQSWNYVKTNGANAKGMVPADILPVINGILNGGVTFWHTDDVGNYALNNSIV